MTTYRGLWEDARTHVRSALLEAAGALLVERGPAGFTMRAIAERAGCSTTVLYTTFGGKDGIASELYEGAFARFGACLGAAPTSDDPLADLHALALAYRSFATANTVAYRLMFGRAMDGVVVAEDCKARSRSAFDILVDAVARGMAAGVLAEGDPVESAQVIWATVHGVVDLELDGVFADADDAARHYEVAARAIVRGLAPVSVAAAAR